jgi:ABC-2 type transport system ATP-binding protein/lipopolysaccharide transport system ATP-binding protein
MQQPAVEFHDVTLRYRKPDHGIISLKEWVIHNLTSRMAWRELHALSHVSFTVEPGKSFGIIGPNGAGKSTLLRVAGGILAPTEGEAIMRGSIAPIIELGTGFEHELSGRENIFFSGALFGRSRTEMETRFDEIIAFSELEDFVDVPLRTYSTGMIARLAFAVATAVEPDILILDEVLAVGDERFRLKCEQRMNSFRNGGATILLVSHNLELMQTMCDEVLWLDHGEMRALGPAAEVVKLYKDSVVVPTATEAGETDVEVTTDEAPPTSAGEESTAAEVADRRELQETVPPA